MILQQPIPEFGITHDRLEDGVHRLRLTGVLADGAGSRLHELAKKQLAASPQLLALDLTDLVDLMPSGAWLLADIAEWAGETDIALCLIAPPDHLVHDVLVAAGLRDLFELHPDLPSALADML